MVQQAQDDEYDLNLLPDNADDQYDIVGATDGDYDEGGAAAQAVVDDEENIDFNNYKGIYADDDAG